MKKDTIEYGQALTEYGPIILLVAIIVMVVLALFSDELVAIYQDIINRL